MTAHLDRDTQLHEATRQRHLKKARMTMNEFEAYAINTMQTNTEKAYDAFNRRFNLTVAYDPCLPRDMRTALTALAFIVAMLTNSKAEFSAAVDEVLSMWKA